VRGSLVQSSLAAMVAGAGRVLVLRGDECRSLILRAHATPLAYPRPHRRRRPTQFQLSQTNSKPTANQILPLRNHLLH